MAEKKDVMAEEKQVAPVPAPTVEETVAGEVTQEDREIFDSGLKVVKERYTSKKKKTGFAENGFLQVTSTGNARMMGIQRSEIRIILRRMNM